MRWGGGGGGGIKMPLCGCTDALAAIAVWSPFVKTAAPMTKTSASTCAPFVALTEKLVLLLCVFFIGIAPFCCFARRKTRLADITIPQKPPISKSPPFPPIFPSFPSCPFPRHSRQNPRHSRVGGNQLPQGGEC